MKHTPVNTSWLLGFLTSWLLVTQANAQYATISGRILRRGAVPMAGAHVSYVSPAGWPAYGACTDSTGFYRITGIALSVPASHPQTPRIGAVVANSVGSTRNFYFASAKPLREADIFDLLGRRVATVNLSRAQVNGTWINAGFWNGVASTDVPAANGVYFAAVAGESGMPVLKFIHLREGAAAPPTRVDARTLAALAPDIPASSPARGRATLDDAYLVTLEPDSCGPRFIPRTFDRTLHDGDNGEVVDTVWSAAPRSILFIGNSYTYVNGGVDVHLANLFHTAHPGSGVVTASVTVGGYTLGDHFAYGPTHTAIDSGGWDTVVLQEQSERPVLEPDSFFYYARLLNGEIVRVRSETAFYMTWARQNDPPMIEPLAAAYDSIGRELGAIVSPCGRAFQRVCEEDTTLCLYDSDGSHPSVWGTYLTCCVFYAALLQESPVGIGYVNDPQITMQQRTYLQSVAWETVTEQTP